MNNEIADWNWAVVFIEVALRAIRRVHYEYGLWGIGRQWEMTPFKAKRINMGQGIELADERAVCAAITQEFISSPSLTGSWAEAGEGGRKEHRYFTIDREMKYSDNSKKVDIYIRKFVLDANKNTITVPEPSFIEAKRARLWLPRIDEGTAESKDIQSSDVVGDIKKLRAEMATRQEPIHCHLLIWGIYDSETSEDDPVKFFTALGDTRVKMHQLRWLPTEWTVPTIEQIKTGEIQLPKVRKALWVALAEVFKIEGS